MKIQIFADTFHGYLSNKTSGEIFGGQEILLLETCKLLIANGHEVNVVQLSDRDDLLMYHGIKIKKIKAPKLLLLQKFGFIRRWTWAGILFSKYIDKSADWIHLHNHHFSFPLVFFKNKNQVMTGMNHGVEWDVPWVYKTLSIKNIRDRFSFNLLKLVTRFSVSKLDKIISNDRFFIHYTTLRKPHLSYKFKYIPNYWDERIFDFNLNVDNDIVRDVINFSNGRKIVLLPKMAGRDRGTDLLIECAELSTDWCLVISGVSNDTDNYIKHVSDNKLQNKVFFAGHVDYKIKLPQLYQVAHLVVIPSPCREATAIALLEAMAMKKPVVVSEIGGLVEIVDDRYNGILCNSNVDELSNSINEILMSQSLSNELSINAYKTVADRFNRKVWSDRMNKFFES